MENMENSNRMETKENFCPDCKKSFKYAQSYIKHLRFHTKIKCSVCSKTLKNKKSYLTHEKKFHPKPKETVVKVVVEKKKKEKACRRKISMKCSLCETVCDKGNLYLHLKSEHDIDIVKEKRTFDNFIEFEKWKKQLEISTKSFYRKETGKKTSFDITFHYFACHRSGKYIASGRGKRKLKCQGSCRIGRFCPAYMKVSEKIDGGSCIVEFVDQHLGHSGELEHFRIAIGTNKNEMMWDAATNTDYTEVEESLPEKMLEAIVYTRGNLSILNQLLLPAETVYENITSVKDGFDSIYSMKVRGAPAISIVAALSLAVEITQHEFKSKEDLHRFVVQNLEYLLQSRPTAVNLHQLAKMITRFSEQLLHNVRISEEDMKLRLLERTETLLTNDIQINRSIGQYGGEHIVQNCSKKATILTHCNTGSLATAGYGTALGVIRWLHRNKHLEHTYCTETRPYNQGARLTAYELVHDHIPSTLVCDSMVASLMHLGKISAVVVGADRVVLNGDTANKIGTYQIAVCAKYHNVPFYVACPRSTFDFTLPSGELIPIEERPHHEMLSIGSVRIAAEGIGCWNPAFDVTPAELITGGIITEVGVFPPSDLEANLDLLSAPEIFS